MATGEATRLLRHYGFGDTSLALEKHLDAWIESCYPEQLAAVFDSSSLSLLCTAFSKAGGCEGTIWLFDGSSNELVASFNSGESREMLVGFRQPVGQGIISMVFSQQQSYCENQIEANDGHDDTLDRKISKHTTAMIAVPLHFGFGLRGVVSCVQLEEAERSREGFSSADVDTLARAVNLVERLINESLYSAALGFSNG